MKKYILRYFLLSITISALFVSCRKDEFDKDENAIGDKGATIVKVLEGPVNAIFFTPFTEIKKVDLFSVRRDANSEASLNTPINVQLTADPAAITAYNTANSDSFEALPDAIYTLSAPGFTKTATGYTVAFGAQDFAKSLTINLDGSKYDLSKKYALAFKITDVGSAKLTESTQKTIIVLISIKNKYDGTYEISGTLNDIASPTISHFSNFINSTANVYTTPPYKLELRTISATKCAAYDSEFFGDGANGYQMPITSGTTYSRYGTFGIIIEFDPATDKVVAVTNYYGQPAANTRSAQLDPSGVNKWVGGTMNIKYNMLQPSVVTTAPFIRSTWDETWKYLGPR